MEKEKNYRGGLLNILNNYKKSLRILNQVDKKFIFLAFFSVMITGVLPAISIRITQFLINGIQTQRYTLSEILVVLGIYIVFNIIISIFTLFNQYYTSLFQYKLERHINIMILEKSGTLSYQSYENTEAYDKIQRAQSSNKIFAFFSYLLTIMQLIITFGSYLIILSSWRWWVIFFIFTTAFINTFLLNRINRFRYEMLRARTEKEREKWYYNFLLTNDIAFKEIRTYNLAEFFIQKYKKIYDYFLKEDRLYLKKSSKVNFVVSMLDEICVGGTFLIIILDAYQGRILLGDSIAYINVTNNIKSTVKQLLLQISAIYNDNLYINQLFEFLDMPEERISLLPEKELEDIYEIDIRNLKYRYNLNKKYILKNININFKRGETIAIVGKNGAGKSTFIKILAALYDSYEGSIKINGIEMKQLNKNSLRNQIAILFQDFSKYELSLRENISVSDISNINNDEYIKKVVEKIDLKSFTNLEQQLGNWFKNGKQLSGGEWIKVGIGRALFKNSSLFILDEPNAALDALTEITIFDNIKQLVKNKICIIITHRIANIPFYADKVLVMDKGEIVAFDTHEKLVNSCELYNELYMADLKIVAKRENT